MLWRWCPTTHKNGKSLVYYHLSSLIRRFELTSYILPRATEKSQEAGTALHMLGTLHWSYNAQNLYIYFSWKVWCAISHWGACFQLFVSAWQFEMIENGSHLARKWCIRAGTEPNATIGQLVKTWMPIGCGTTHTTDTKKAHAQPVAGAFDTYMHARDQNKFFVFWG